MDELNKDQEEQIYELSDLKISSVGLVRSGANKESFFLIKSADAQPDDASDLDKSESVPADSLWQKFTNLIKQVIHQEITKTDSSSDEANELEDDPSKQAEDEQAEDESANNSSQEEEANEESEDEAQTRKFAAEATSSEGLSASIEEVTTPSHQGLEVGSSSPTGVNKSMDENIEKADLLAKLEAFEKSNQDLLSRVEKAEQEAAIEKESRERQVYLQKAAEMPALPVPTTETADFMYWLRKSDAKRADWFESVLKAVDYQLKKSELFVEKGTSRTPTEVSFVEKAQAAVDRGEAKDLREALMKMSPEEQALYVAQRQQETK